MCVLFRFKTKWCQLLKRMKEKQYFSRVVSENRENENFLQAKKIINLSQRIEINVAKTDVHICHRSYEKLITNINHITHPPLLF